MAEENKGVVEETTKEEEVLVDTEKKVEQTLQEETKTDGEFKKVLDLNELLKNDKEFASQFDAKVSKSINTAKEKWDKEFEEKLNKEKTELQKGFENEKSIYQTKIVALSKNVKAENIDDVITLAGKYKKEDNTIEDAIVTVLEKYPSFKGETNRILKAGKEVGNTQKKSETNTMEYLKKEYPHKYN